MIGILTRKDLSPSKREVYVTYKAINDVINRFGKTGIGILPNNLDKIKKVIDKCDGIILQGGSDFDLLDLEIVKYIYEQDIPCLGICLGMQMMSYLFNGKIGHLNNNHLSNNKYAHNVITKNSQIYNSQTFKVNSRHNDYVIDTNLEVTGYSEDGIIEMVESKNKKFFIGVQWHPENLIEDDLYSYMLFSDFFEATKH